MTPLHHWWEHLAAGWLLPRKPKHVDQRAEARRARCKHIMRTAARRDSFRRFWRERRPKMEALKGLPRPYRRYAALQAWRVEKRG